MTDEAPSVSRRRLIGWSGAGAALAGVGVAAGLGPGVGTSYARVAPAAAVGSPMLDGGYVNAADYGAVGDYVLPGGAGTDSTAPIQAALDACQVGQPQAGKMVLLPAGRYKITAPLVIRQGSGLAGPFRVKGGTKTGQGLTNQTTLYFAGGGVAHAITAQDNASKLRLQDFKLCDMRVNPTAGDGIHLAHVFNDIQVVGVEVDWTPATTANRFTGSCIWVGGNATAGTTSDCLNFEDLWVLGGQYGIYCAATDNTNLMRNIKCDTPATSNGQVAVIRVASLAACHIDGVKHENSAPGCASIVVEGGTYQVITSVVSRLGTGGACVRIVGPGTGVSVQGLARQNSGTLVETYQGSPLVLDKKVIGLRLGMWQGGFDGYMLNEGGFVGDGAANPVSRSRILTVGRFAAATFAALSTGSVRIAKALVKPDVSTDVSLAVTNMTGQTGAKLDVYTSGDGTSDLTVDAAGNTNLRRSAIVGGATSKIGFYGTPGVVRPTVTGTRANGAALSDLLKELAALGLIIDSSTT